MPVSVARVFVKHLILLCTCDLGKITCTHLFREHSVHDKRVPCWQIQCPTWNVAPSGGAFVTRRALPLGQLQVEPRHEVRPASWRWFR